MMMEEEEKKEKKEPTDEWWKMEGFVDYFLIIYKTRKLAVI